MTNGPDFHELIGEEGSPEELERLRRVHDLLVAAGPPPELAPKLARPPRLRWPAQVRALPRRRAEATLALAAAVLAIAFGVGYLVGNQGDGFTTVRVVAMKGVGELAAASASIRVGADDGQGNWPLILSVEGLRELPAGGWYELDLTRRGQPVASCGTFKVGGGATTEVRMNVPYKLRSYDGWVVTAYVPGHEQEANKVLLRTETI